ncbi:hypothetical protein PG996_007137 [Apiospora saccharicola]|uniref:Folliculin-interacting protein N-terminal domain-containing protein n=1 Tax=Apiospora saccharicola TaxID=335842 RepID=A0ABR1V9Y5_9PEZI
MDFQEPLLDCNFAEVLVGDLDRSSAIFKSKNLTAGAPAPGFLDEGSARRLSLQDESMRPAEYGTLSRLKSLQTMNQPSYSPFVMTNTNGHQPRKSSDSTHSFSTTSSGGMEPPSIATREVSVTTAPTSGRPSPDKLSEYSWMDFGANGLDLEEFGAEDRRRSMSVIQLAPPPAQTADVDDYRSMSMGCRIQKTAALPVSSFNPKIQISHSQTTPVLPSRQPSTTFGSPRSSPQAPYGVIPQRRSSLNHNNAHKPLNLRISPPSPTRSARYSITGFQPAAVPSTYSPASSVSSISDYDPPFGKGDSPRSFDDRREVEVTLPPRKEEVSTPMIAAHLVHVEEWLNSSIDMGFPQQPQTDNEHAASRFPVPTEVLDTLRVSVSCFPETMLLCSSLSIETIRGHSRKFKYGKLRFASESQTSLALTDDSSSRGNNSKWKWFGPSKRQQQDQSPKSPKKSQQQQQQQRPPQSSGSMLEPVTPTSPFNTPGGSDWMAIKRIFPTGTDYLCDALYAHILAYNYITSLCPRSASATSAPRPSSKSSVSSYGSSLLGPELASARTRNSDSTKIPRKAASLLGMETDTSATTIPEPNSNNYNYNYAASSRTKTMRSQSSFVRRHPSEGKNNYYGKNFTTAANRNADEHDASLKELRLGLAKCIARLIATLRITTNGPSTTAMGMAMGGSPSSKSMGDESQQHIDPFLIRSLCEIVRSTEYSK